MSRTLVIATLVAALALGAAATGDRPLDCLCDGYVDCFDSLYDCEKGHDPVKYQVHDSDICKTTLPPSGYFSCRETPYKCRFIGNCTLARPPRHDDCKCKDGIQCFDTVAQCKNIPVGVMSIPTDGVNTDCLAVDKPVYSCVEKPYECRSSETCRKVHDGHGNQDPHFRGFDGSDYYFEGEAGQDYNIISDVSLQINAHFIRLNHLKGTYMGRLGLRFGEHALSFDPHFGVFFNNSVLTHAEVELPEGSFAIDTVGGAFRLLFQNDVYHLLARVALEKGQREEAYLNLDAALIGMPNDPHGILGQTARAALDGVPPTAFKVEGTEEDYHVLDGLLGTHFTFNRFAVGDEQPLSVTGSVVRSRLRRAAAQPLFEAIVY